MAFLLEDRDPSITSESAPFIEPVDYDSDVELFQVPLKRDRSPLEIPGQDLVSKAALQYALVVAPRALSEESISIYSQPHLSRDTSPQRPSSSPPSSLSSADANDQKHQQSTPDDHDNKLLEAKELQLKRGKATTILTKRPRRLILPLQTNTYLTGHHEEDWSHIYQWLDQCHDNTATQETDTTGTTVGALAGPQLLHPFLGPSLFSPDMPTSKQPTSNIITSNPPTNQQPPPTQKIRQQTTLPSSPTPTNPFIHLQKSQPLQDEPDQPSPTRKSSKHATPDSAYDRAREVELSLSKSLHFTHRVPVKGKDHWVVDCDLTEISHSRLAEVARRSAEGFYGGGWREGRVVDGERAAELANLYRVLAVVHVIYGEEMKGERERVEGRGRMGSKIGSVKGRRVVRNRRGE